MALLTMVALASFAPVAAAQCQFYRECFQVPWAIPQFAELQSPTPFPTVVITQTYTPTPFTPTATPTIVPTSDYTPVNATAVVEQLQTLQAIASGTPVPISIVTQSPAMLGANAAVFWGYAKGLGDGAFGDNFSPLITFGMAAILFLVALKFSLIIIPVLMSLIGAFRKVIRMVLDFIPGF